MKIGAQLFTVRDTWKTAEEFDITMGKVAEIGYRGVQFSPWRDIGALNIREIANRHGLEIIVTHYPQQKLLDDVQTAMAEHEVLGTKLVGMGAMPTEYRGSMETVSKFISDYSPTVDELWKNGYKFMYHNHDFEFEKYSDKLIFNYLLEAFPPEKMGVILDLFWVQAAGADPVYWLNKLKGRVEVVHFKDYAIIGGQRKPREVMEGNMNWGTHVAACREAGVEWAFVEQEEFNGKDPFDCLKTSFENLRKAGLC